MAERKGGRATSTSPEAARLQSLYEVLTRRPDGHETVHRFRAADDGAARDHVVHALEVPGDQVVEVKRVE